MRSFKILMAIVVTLLVSACGGGGGSNSGNSGSGSSSGATKPENYVSGTFQYSTTTGQKFPDGTYSNSKCVNGASYDRYFESENVLVFSNSNQTTDDDYKFVATSVQNQFPKILLSMGLSMDEFLSLRPIYAPMTANDVVNLFDYDADTDLPEALLLRSHPRYETDIANRHAIRNATWLALSHTDQERVVKAFETHSNRNPIIHKIPRKLVVCLDSGRVSDSSYAEGSLLGLDIAPRSVNNRKDTEQIIAHELVHSIQANVAAPTGTPGAIDRWFLEGQAVVISGQAVAKKNDGYNPTQVVSILDESYVTVKYPYEHYGMAYSFLAKNNTPAAFHQLYLDIRNHDLSDSSQTWGQTLPAFIKGFDNNMKNSGQPLTLENFKTNYLNLVK